MTAPRPNHRASGPVDAIAEVPVVFDWDYDRGSGTIANLFSQAKDTVWDPATDIDWSIPVEFGSPVPPVFGRGLLADRTPFGIPASQRDDLLWHTQAWMVSQFLHGEQGALIAAGRLVETVPDVGWKLCAAGQALDEARHVEAFSRYIDDKLGVAYPVNTELRALLADIAGEGRWDMVLLGMQVLVEGTAIGSFSLARLLFFDPLARQIVDRVLRDEARHVAFGLSILAEPYASLTPAERAERLEFVRTAGAALRTRFSLEDVRAQFDAAPTDAADDAFVGYFTRKAMGRLPPMLKRIGLWDDSVAAALGTSR